MTVYDGTAGVRYGFTPQGRIAAVVGEHHEYAAGEVPAAPVFRLTVGDYIRQGSSFDLMFLLSDLIAGGELGASCELTSGYRRWWIGSLLGAVRDGVHLPPPPPRLAELERFFARMLRGYGCGYTLAPHVAKPTVEFPVVPADDMDEPVAAFTAPECARLFRLLDESFALQPRFDRPPLKDNPGDSTNWDDWVREMVIAFQAIKALPLREPRLVTFIG